jgi:SAM-dependent methyltransferase
MDVENRLIVNSDVEVFNKYKSDSKSGERSLEERYPHPCGTWGNVDAFIKWGVSMVMFDKIKQPGMKVVDLGAGDGPVAHMISDQGYDVVGVDIKSYDFEYQSLAVMITKDAIEFLRDYEDNSVDVFMDGCAVTHFNDSGGDEETPNKGWRSVLEAVYKVLKPGGYFICTSDIECEAQTSIGEFILPEDIVRMAKESGLVLTSEFNYSRDDRFSHTKNLGIANFVFTKAGYKALHNSLCIKNSPVAGQGVFAAEDIPSGTVLGMSHVEMGDVIHRTPLGGFINHSEEPNCMKWCEDGKYYIKTLRFIGTHEELFLKYSFYEVK